MKKGDKRVIRAWTMYDWANSAYSLTVTSAVFPAFYVGITSTYGEGRVTEEYGAPAASLYPWALSAGFLVVALLTPILSGIADSRGNKKFFLKLFCYVGAAACAGLFFFSMEHLWLGLTLVALACIGFSGSLTFYDAFLPEIAEEADQDRISARGYTMGYIGSVILLILNLAMVMMPETFFIPETVTLFGREWGAVPARLSFLSVALWWVGWAQLAFRRLPDTTPSHVDTAVGVVANGYRELRNTWLTLRKTVRLKRYLIAFFVLNMGIQTVMYLAANFAKQEVKELNGAGEAVPIGDASLITSILIIQLVAIPGALTFVRLSKRFGNVKALMIGATVWIIACLWAFRVVWANEFYLLAGLVGLIMGGSQALTRSTYSKFLPETTDTASFFSFYDVSYYVGTVLGTTAYGIVYALTEDLRSTIIAIGSFFVAGLLLLWRVPKEEVLPTAAA